MPAGLSVGRGASEVLEPRFLGGGQAVRNDVSWKLFQHTCWTPPQNLGRQEGFEKVLGNIRRLFASRDPPS